MEADREFQFTYRFAGSEWGFTLFAANPDEARKKIKTVSLARYDGEVMARLPAGPGVGGLVRLICKWKNWRPHGRS